MRDRSRMSYSMSASYDEQTLSAHPGMLSEPVPFCEFVLLKAMHTSTEDTVSVIYDVPNKVFAVGLVLRAFSAGTL